MISDRSTAGEKVTATDTTTSTKAVFRRVLIPVGDASQAQQGGELARRVGASEARVLHLSLRENIGGRRFAIETEADASYAVEATIFELRMAGLGAAGGVPHVLVGKAAEAIPADAAERGADLIALWASRRRE